ncbi:MAG: hypothetical protein AB7P33_02015 [Dehalococcoidia bacterium]
MENLCAAVIWIPDLRELLITVLAVLCMLPVAVVGCFAIVRRREDPPRDQGERNV